MKLQRLPVCVTIRPSRPRGGVWIETGVAKDVTECERCHAPAGACGLKHGKGDERKKECYVTPPRGRVD